MEAKKGAEVIYIRPDPLHVWYASFTVCQTLRMWSCVFDECENVFDRVLALRALEFFQQPPDKVVSDKPQYTKNDAFLDILRDMIKAGSNIKVEDFYRKKKGKGGEQKPVKPKAGQKESELLVIPEQYEKMAKRRMMDVHQEQKRKKKEQALHPDEGPVDYYEKCIVGEDCL